VLVLPRSSPVIRRFYQENLPHVRPPAGYVQIYSNRDWRALVSPGCPGVQSPA
jgi:hypothetical protein